MEIRNQVLKNEEKAIFELRSLYQQYGYKRYKMSKFEEYDLYARNKDFLVSDSVITFTDTNGKLLALKPDVTLSIIKDSKEIKGYAQKVYYNENVYRVSNRTHSYKEITQVGLECIGAVDRYHVLEVIMLALKSLAAIKQNFVLDLSHLGILAGLLTQDDLTEEAKSEMMSCVAQKNIHELTRLCDRYHTTEDFCHKITTLVSLYGEMETVLPQVEILCENQAMQEAFIEFKEICTELSRSGFGGKINIDFSLVNDMNYYTGIAFKGFVQGISESILSGGAYDNLMRKMGKNFGGIGFAVYLDKLERLDTEEIRYDVDTVILYEDGVSAWEIEQAIAKNMSENGVVAQKAIPNDLRYKRLLKLTQRGVTEIENHG